MSKSKRNSYMVLRVVLNVCEGLQRTDAHAKATNDQEGRLLPKSRESVKRIIAKVQASFPDFATKTASDGRYLMNVATKLKTMWSDDEYIPRAAFIALALNMVVDHKNTLPHNATKARALFDTLEGMIATLYSHTDPNNEAIDHMNHGERMAREYMRIAIAA